MRRDGPGGRVGELVNCLPPPTMLLGANLVRFSCLYTVVQPRTGRVRGRTSCIRVDMRRVHDRRCSDSSSPLTGRAALAKQLVFTDKRLLYVKWR